MQLAKLILQNRRYRRQLPHLIIITSPPLKHLAREAFQLIHIPRDKFQPTHLPIVPLIPVSRPYKIPVLREI